MNNDDDIYKEVLQDGIEFPKPPDRKRCPSPEALAKSFEPGASRRAKKRIVDHLSKCLYCQEEFKFYHELQSFHRGLSLNERTGSPDSPANRSRFFDCPFGRPLWTYASILLGLALISSVVLLLFQSIDISDFERGEEAAIVLDYPQHSYRIRDELIFRWERYPAAQHYVLELFDDSLLPLWTSPAIQDLQTRLPPEMRPVIKAGKFYYWMVTAYSGPVKVAESVLTQFIVFEE